MLCNKYSKPDNSSFLWLDGNEIYLGFFSSSHEIVTYHTFASFFKYGKEQDIWGNCFQAVDKRENKLFDFKRGKFSYKWALLLPWLPAWEIFFRTQYKEKEHKQKAAIEMNEAG